MQRRNFFKWLTAGSVAVATLSYWGSRQLLNSCPRPPLPAALSQHPLVQQAFQDIDPNQILDVHLHLTGTGDSGQGVWVNPIGSDLSHPIEYLKRQFLMNAACVDRRQVDQSYVAHLKELADDFPSGARFLLLAFDYYHNEENQAEPSNSAFYIPNDYAAKVANTNPERFTWCASIHPYRADGPAALAAAKKAGAIAVKWLPQAMGIEADSHRCNQFYQALIDHNIPLGPINQLYSFFGVVRSITSQHA